MASVTRPVGREAALATLAQAWRRALAGDGQAVLVSGEAGMGKTLLVRSFTADLTDTVVLTGQCVSLGADVVPYAAVSQVLRGLVNEVGVEQARRWAGPGTATLATLVPALATGGAAGRTDGVLPAAGANPAGDVERVQLFSAVVDVLEQAARVRPLVIVLEDLHWADQGTGHLARLLAPALSQVPVLLLLTYRSEELTGRHPLRPVIGELARRGTSLRLDALTPEHTATIVRAVLPDCAPAAVHRIVERSEGVPYFAEELAVTTGGLGALPGTLRDALLTRVHWLAPAAQEVLRLAAVAGPAVIHRLLAAAAGQPAAELEAVLREIVDAGLLVVEGDGYASRHALLRDAVHDDLLPGEHDRLHGRLADLIQQRRDLVDGRSNELAHHLLAARRYDEAFRECLARAGGEELRPDSLTLLESALELWERVPDPEAVLGPHHEVLARAAEAALFLGERGRAARYIDASLAELPPDADPLVLSARLRMKARSRYWGPEALPLAQQALDVCPRDHPTLELARAYDMLANLSAVTGHSERAAELATEGLAVVRAVGDAGTEANLLITLGGACCSTGRAAEGLALFDEAAAVASAAALVGGTWGLMRYHTNLSHYLNLAGRYERAVEVAGSGEAMANQAGLRLFKGTMLAGNLAEPLIALGDLSGDGVWGELDAARGALPPAVEDAPWRAWYAAERSDAVGATDATDATDAAEAWRAALEPGEVGRPVILELLVRLGLLERLVADGDAAAASATHAAASEIAERIGATGWLRILDAALGLPAAPAQRAVGPAALTARELEVLRLVAEGRTNGEIGQALFVSTKTASVHVSNILAKLGVASRGEAAAWAHRSGAVETGPVRPA